MANLFNKYIYETYKSIIGIGQSGTSGLTANLEPLTDGEGKELPIEVSETEVNLTAPTTVPNLFIEGYGEVINAQGYFVGEGGGGGGTGTSGTSGTSGLTGSSGTAGTSGQNGSSGTSGRNGFNGLNGTSGTSGVSNDGTSGTSGVNGSSGLTGPQGPQGPQGANGTSGITGVAINDTATSTTVTGTTTETITETIFVPANTIKDGDIFLLNARMSGIKSVSATTLYKVYINTSAAIGGTAITGTTGTGLSTTQALGTLYRYLYINKADGTGTGTAFVNASVANETLGGFLSTQYATAAINWTQDQYIVITATLGNIANSAFIAGSSFTNAAGGKGQDGSSGIAGPQGPQGPAGGSSGTNGSSGTSGLTGTAGTSGTSGVDGNAGLVNGTGLNSLKSADNLTSDDAIAAEDGAIAIGNGAHAYAANSIAIGQNAHNDDNLRVNSVMIGSCASPQQTKAAQYSTAVGSQARAIGANSLALGYDVFCAGNNASAIGQGAQAVADNSVALGGVTANTQNTLSTILIQSALTVDKNFADDTAAATGGIPVGGFYHTNGILKIRIA